MKLETKQEAGIAAGCAPASERGTRVPAVGGRPGGDGAGRVPIPGDSSCPSLRHCSGFLVRLRQPQMVLMSFNKSPGQRGWNQQPCTLHRAARSASPQRGRTLPAHNEVPRVGSAAFRSPPSRSGVKNAEELERFPPVLDFSWLFGSGSCFPPALLR